MNTLKVRLHVEGLDGRIMPDGTGNDPPTDQQAATTTLGNAVTATINVNDAKDFVEVSGAAALPDLISVSLEIGYIENGVGKTKIVVLKVDAEGSFTGDSLLPAGWTYITVAGYYSSGGVVERVETLDPVSRSQ